MKLEDIDIDRLREELVEEFGAAAYSGFPVAMVDVFDCENATDEEIVAKALNLGYDLNSFKKDMSL